MDFCNWIHLIEILLNRQRWTGNRVVSEGISRNFVCSMDSTKDQSYFLWTFFALLTCGASFQHFVVQTCTCICPVWITIETRSKSKNRNHLHLVSCALLWWCSFHVTSISFARNCILTIINSNCVQFTECPVSHSPFNKKCTKEEKFCQLNEVKIFSLLYPSICRAVDWFNWSDCVVHL